jgi:hypothetical protein
MSYPIAFRNQGGYLLSDSYPTVFRYREANRKPSDFA